MDTTIAGISARFRKKELTLDKYVQEVSELIQRAKPGEHDALRDEFFAQHDMNLAANDLIVGKKAEEKYWAAVDQVCALFGGNSRGKITLKEILAEEGAWDLSAAG